MKSKGIKPASELTDEELLKKYGCVPLAILFNGWFPRTLIVYFLIKI